MEFNDRRKPRSRETDNAKDARYEANPNAGHIAKCGHEDTLGYLSNTVCGKCARKNHKKAMGR